MYSDDGIIILTDIGSSVMTAEMAIELNPDKKIILSKASLVEGAFSASIYAENNMSLQNIVNKLSEDLKNENK